MQSRPIEQKGTLDCTYACKVLQSSTFNSCQCLTLLISCFFSHFFFYRIALLTNSSVTNYSSASDYKGSTTMFTAATAEGAVTKSSHNHQPVNSMHDVSLYSDKVTLDSKHMESNVMNESKSMNNSNYANEANFSNVLATAAAVTAPATSTRTSSTSSNGKMLVVEHMIKSEKPKSFSESVNNANNKRECTENGHRIDESAGSGSSSVNHMNLIGSSLHQASSSCYPSAVLDASTIESSAASMIADDLGYRGYSTGTNDLTRSSFANDMMANRTMVANYDYSAVRGYENAMNGIPSGYDPLSNLYASSALSMQRSNLAYPSYLNTFGSDVDANQQKYLHDAHHAHHHHHYASNAMLKNDTVTPDTATPYYPKPMYHYDPAFPLTGFSAMNLSLRTAAAAAAAAAAASGSGPIADFTSSNLPATNSPHYASVQRLQANSASTPPKSSRTPPNSSPHADHSEHSDNNRTPLNSLKLQSYQLHGENFAANSRTSPTEPVDLCNSEIEKSTHSGAFTATAAGTTTADNQSIETAPNRPFSRESTSDSNASPYVDAYKGDPMGKFSHCYTYIVPLKQQKTFAFLFSIRFAQ